MINEYSFLRLYEDLANQQAQPAELDHLFLELQDRVQGLPKLASWFAPENPSPLERAVAIDAVAHAIHAGEGGVLEQVFPGADGYFVKSYLDRLAGLEVKNEVRRPSRGYFSTVLSQGDILLLEKEDAGQMGKTTREDIAGVMQEYQKLFDAGVASKAEVLTLSRFYPDQALYQKALQKLGIGEESEPLVVGGPASVEMVDREGHLITMEAMSKAFDKFMGNFRARNVMALHSDVQVGWPLPAYINKRGEVFKSGVDDKQFWLISEIRDDTKIGQRVAEEINKGELKSYSIAGSAIKTQNVQKGLQPVMQVDELELSEVTICFTEKVGVWTKTGLRSIKDIQIGEEVFTHQNRWRKVTRKFEHAAEEEILRIQTEGGTLEVTKEHPIRALVYGGRNIGTHYEWVEAQNLKVGSLVSTHIKHGNCSLCDAPLFKEVKVGQRNFCGNDCKHRAIGNRAGKTIASGDLGTLAQSKKPEDVLEKVNEFLGNSFSRVVSIEPIPYSGIVYNLEVEEDNSYTTEAAVVHNCAKGINQGANFEILKSAEPFQDIEKILASFSAAPISLAGYGVVLEKSSPPRVVILADRRNSWTDALLLELRKALPTEVPVVVLPKGLVKEAVPILKIGGFPLGS